MRPMSLTRTMVVLWSLAAGLVQVAWAAPNTYLVDYQVSFEPSEGHAQVVINWGEGAEGIRHMELLTHPRMRGFESNVPIKRDGKYLVLESISQGTSLSYQVSINNLRSDGKHDARITEDWAIWRGDDLVPAGRIRQKKNTEAIAHLTLKGPADWSFRTPYQKLKDGRYRIDNPQRSYDRPTGWMVGGKIGVRSEKIAGVTVTVAAPVGQAVRRMDILAFLNWTLPALAKVVPQMPKRLLLVSAREGMWRGGLSAGNSLYLHADRPLISENGTSTVLHELVHVMSGLDSVDGADWIVEGLAEYYSVKLLRRTGTITDGRFDSAISSLRRWSEQAGPLDALNSTGPTTAKAVLVMLALDEEIARQTNGDSSLDDLMRSLSGDRDVSMQSLRSAHKALTGKSSQVLMKL